MMRVDDLVRLSTRMFKTRPLRTSLTILGVGVGIAAIVFLVSLGYGLQTLLLERITTSESLLSIDVNPSESGLVPLTPKALDTISALPHVKEISAVANAPAQISINQFTGDALANIINPSYFRLAGTEVSSGRLFTEDDHGKTIVSSTTLKLFNLKPEDALEKTITINLYFTPAGATDNTEPIEKQGTFTIVGIIDSDVSSFIYLDQRDIPDITFPEYASAKVRVESADYLESVRDQVKDMGFTVFALIDTINEANKIFGAMQVTLALFGIVALLVAAIGMFNTVTITLLERTQEIGIMKAVGAANSDIFIMFLAESALMGLLGGLSGVLLGYLGGDAVNFLLNLLAARLGGKSLSLFSRPLWFIGGVVAFSAIVGFLTGILPARRAAKINTLAALRYK